MCRRQRAISKATRRLEIGPADRMRILIALTSLPLPRERFSKGVGSRQLPVNAKPK